MRVVSSLKHARKRSSGICVVRRGKKIVAFDKANPRFKVKQGRKK
ncbi:MAG: hypothetical protein P857_395 [Candidatus Xenolissoclinum pacificiensis L6]|uniref:50S ribosomal protein L36 n=1 Tax=Candidatus Xenolissoclinum pacificiensis L6 TaxID=1401685 RepID=W2UYT6_9RICK|nr:MAG: hypothetical protein P857_395 [Candidatus Xenolissoclinum pacificiensis L6]